MCFALITANCFLRVTSRIECAHAELKQHLRISTGNLLDVVESIHLLIKNKTEKIVESLVTAKQRTPFCLRKPYFEDVISLVTPTALAHIQGQVELAEASDFDIFKIWFTQAERSPLFRGYEGFYNFLGLILN